MSRWALSDPDHIHSKAAWKWLKTAPEDRNIVFSRFTHVGLLRLLTNASVMGDRTMALSKNWGVYDKWLEDPWVKFYPDPRNLDAAFRKLTEPFAVQPATKAVGDCFLLAMRKKFKPRWSLSTRGSTGWLANTATALSFRRDKSAKCFIAHVIR